MIQRLSRLADYVPPIPKVLDPGTNNIHNVLGVVFGIAGGAALIIIILAGFRMVISQGDSAAVAKARNTIIYAVIGLIVMILSYSILTFVVGRL